MSSLVEAKNMYLRKLNQILSPEIYSGFKTMFRNVEKFCKEHQLKEVVSYFQKELEKIPHWSRDKLTEETIKIQSTSDCDYLMDIITALIMVNVKILVDDVSTQIDLEIPQLYMFVHKCYCLIGRELWSNPELMLNNGTSSERQRNYNLVMKLIYQGINDTIQFYLPMKPILNRYLHNQNQKDYEDNISLSEENENDEVEGNDSLDESEEQEQEEVEKPSNFFDDADDIVSND